MATLPGLTKGVTQDPTPPATDTVVAPITIPDGTILVTTKTTNETITNVDKLIDYVSGDASPDFIPKSAIVDGAEVFTWTGNHSTGGLKLFAPNANDVILNAPIGQGVLIEVNAVQEYLFNATTLNMFNNTLDIGSGKIMFTSTSIAEISSDIEFNVANVIDLFKFGFASSVEVSLGSTEANFGAAGASYTLQFGGISNRRITNSIAGFVFEVETGDIYSYEFLGVGEYSYTETQADFNNNNLINVAIITPTIASFVNATHNHQDAVGAGQLNALNALDATGTQDSTTFLRGDNTWDVPPGTEVFTWTADHSMATFKLTASIGNNVILNAPSARSVDFQVAGVQEYVFGASQANFNNNDLVNVAIITPTIASFVNATHNHQDAAGGGTLLSTSALSDTADIAYLNTTNVYIAGNRQDFLGLLAGTAGLNVGGIAGNPTTQVDGDIWLNTSTNQIFGRINGVDVDLGAGGGTGLTSINGDTTAAQVIAGGTGLDIIDVGAIHTLAIDATVVTLSGAQILTNKTIDGNLNTILDINENQLTVSVGVIGTILTSNGPGSSPTYQSAGTGDVVGPASATDNAIARFDSITGKLIQNGVIIIDDVANMQAIRSLQFVTFGTAPIGTTHIALVDNDFHINTTAGNSIQIMVDDIAEFQLDATTLDLMDNNLVMGTAFIQFSSIAEPGASGSDSVGRVFMDVGNLNHLSIRRNGTSIDLEAGGGSDTPWTEAHDFAGFLLTWDVGATNDITTQQVGDILTTIIADNVIGNGVQIAGNGFGNLSILSTNAGNVFRGDLRHEMLVTTDAAGFFQITSAILPASDTGTVPVLVLDARQTDDTGIVSRDIFAVRNNGNDMFSISAAGLWTFLTASEFTNITGITDSAYIGPATASHFLEIGANNRIAWDEGSGSEVSFIVGLAGQIQIGVNDVLSMQITDTAVVFNGAQALSGAGSIAFDESGTSTITGIATDQGIKIDLASGDRFEVHVNSILEYTFSNVAMTFGEGNNIILGTTTGTIIGTAATQRLSFWGTVPAIVQPTHIADPSGGATVDAEARTAINSILSQLADMGLQAST